MTIEDRRKLDHVSVTLEQVGFLLEAVACHHDSVPGVVPQIAGIQALVEQARDHIPSGA